MNAGEGRRARGLRGQLLVDVAPDRRGRVILAVFLAGPAIWLTHFMLVYLVAEAGCTGDGPGLNVFDPPVPQILTLVATMLAAVASSASALWAYRRWRSDDPAPANDGGDERWELEEHARSLAFGGFLLSALSFATILFVGVPALFLSGC